MERGNKGYTLVDVENVLENDDFNIQEQSLYIAILSYHNEEKGYSYPSYKKLKLRSKIKKDATLIKTINSLIDKGYMKKETEKGHGNKYYIATPKMEYPQKRSTPKNGGTPTPKTEEHLLQKRSTTNINTNINNTNKNIYSHIFDYWNSKGIIEHKALTPEREKSIKAALKIYKEDEILKAIDNYSEILSDEGYKFNYKWSLENFLKRKNALPLFMEGGERKINYDTYRKNKKDNQFKTKPKKAADF